MEVSLEKLSIKHKRIPSGPFRFKNQVYCGYFEFDSSDRLVVYLPDGWKSDVLPPGQTDCDEFVVFKSRTKRSEMATAFLGCHQFVVDTEEYTVFKVHGDARRCLIDFWFFES